MKKSILPAALRAVIAILAVLAGTMWLSAQRRKTEGEGRMRILMLGNSFTFFNDLPDMIAELTGAEVVSHTRGGARLAEHLNPKTEMGQMTLEALENESWDFVILQEMSSAPVNTEDAFQKSVSALCEKIRKAGAVPVLYATWAYRRGSERMEAMTVSYDRMSEQLSAAYHEAAERNDALIADVGQVFYKLADTRELYADDGIHPNEEGSRLAAETIAAVIREASSLGDSMPAADRVPAY